MKPTTENTVNDKAPPLQIHFTIHVPGLCEEILCNSGTAILQKPLMILKSLLGEVAQRASKINDAKLNSLMADLTLYQVCDPNSKEYDGKIRQELLNGKHGIDAVRAVNEYDALNAMVEAQRMFIASTPRAFDTATQIAFRIEVEKAKANLAALRSGGAK